MKDRIIQLDNSETYYILEEITLDNRVYVMMVEYDIKMNKLDTENFIIREIIKVSGNFKLEEIPDRKLCGDVMIELLKKYRTEN